MKLRSVFVHLLGFHRSRNCADTSVAPPFFSFLLFFFLLFVYLFIYLFIHLLGGFCLFLSFVLFCFSLRTDVRCKMVDDILQSFLNVVTYTSL